MTISSTEFQQNVGYYLKEAQKGKVIQIRKSKPQKALFTLTIEKNDHIDQKKESTRISKINDLINELNIQNKRESGLDFQKRVRN